MKPTFPIKENDEIEKIVPPKLPFDLNEKIFQNTDDEGNLIGKPYSYEEWFDEIKSLSGVSKDLC